MSRPSEQQALLLRQLAGLRRRGLPQSEALELARAGLGAGPLADRVDAAGQALRAGQPTDGDGLDRLLGRDVATDALDRAADAVEAWLAARAGTATVRLYLGVALAAPLAVWSLGGWLTPDQGLGELGPGTWSAFVSLMAAMRLVGLPLALGVVLVVRRLDLELGSGVSKIRRAARLFEVAASGDEPTKVVTEPAEAIYLHTRTASCGAPQAAAELAAELAREGEQRLALFRHLGPVVALLIALLLAIPPMLLLTVPIVSYLRGWF